MSLESIFINLPKYGKSIWAPSVPGRIKIVSKPAKVIVFTRVMWYDMIL